MAIVNKSDELKKILGFDFVKIGRFRKSDKPWSGISKGKKWEVYAQLDLFDQDYKFAEETVYFVLVEEKIDGIVQEEIVYIGEFTYNLEDRWLNGNYVNHHKSEKVEEALSSGKTVSLWLAIDPYCKAGGILKLNISKALEHELLKTYSPSWNKRNKKHSWEDSWRAQNCKELKTMINIK